MRWRKLKQHKKQSKQEQKPTIPYAGIADKIKAFITDMFMIYIPILYIITYLVMDGKDDFKASSFGPFFGVLLYGLIDAIFISRTGQTPGKKAYTIQVVDINSLQKISFLRAFWRFIVFVLVASTIFALLVPFFRTDRRSLHDLLTRTTLIRVTK